MASKLAEAEPPVACPPQWLPVFLASASTSKPQPQLEPYLPNPGCTARYETNATAQKKTNATNSAYLEYVEAAWDPIEVKYNGARIGFLNNSDVNSKTSCDQLAAIGFNSAGDEEIRGVSSLTSSGYQLGWLGVPGEEIEFRYWNGEEQKEYFVHEKFTVGADGSPENSQGSFNPSNGTKVLELAEIPPCGCQVGCKKLSLGGGLFTDILTGEQCVENEGTCEHFHQTANATATFKCDSDQRSTGV